MENVTKSTHLGAQRSDSFFFLTTPEIRFRDRSPNLYVWEPQTKKYSRFFLEPNVYLESSSYMVSYTKDPSDNNNCAKRFLRPCAHSKADWKICPVCSFVVRRCSDYNHFLRRGYRGVDTCLVALVFWHIDFSGSEKNMLDVCLGTVSVGSRSILNPLFCTFFDPSKSTFWRAWRQIDKKVLEMHFLETVVRASILFLLVLFYCLPVSLCFSFSAPPSLCLSLSVPRSSSRPCRARCI